MTTRLKTPLGIRYYATLMVYSRPVASTVPYRDRNDAVRALAYLRVLVRS